MILEWTLFVVSVVGLVAALWWHERVLRAPDGETSVRPLAVQFVASDEALVAKLSEAEQGGRERLRKAIDVDMFVIAGFVAVFTTFNVLAIELIDRAADGGLQEQGIGICVFMIGAIFVAALLDLAENHNVIHAIDAVDDHPDDPRAALADLDGAAGEIRLAAKIKWAIIGLELLWVLAVLTVAAAHWVS